MTDEEVIAQLREVTGEEFMICPVCGKPVEYKDAILLDRGPELSEPPEQIWICPECQGAIERGEIEFEPLEPAPEEPV